VLLLTPSRQKIDKEVLMRMLLGFLKNPVYSRDYPPCTKC